MDGPPELSEGVPALQDFQRRELTLLGIPQVPPIARHPAVFRELILAHAGEAIRS
jgi:hypothetical protein